MPDLRRLRCTACGANLLDDAAMGAVEAFRRTARSARRVRSPRR